MKERQIFQDFQAVLVLVQSFDPLLLSRGLNCLLLNLSKRFT
ncbi:hypothetical protein CIPAW_04G078200 [Carya illinoinensis]|uniref:Uncharacterized protein n=1 Tax=Carya illinoinensis TaxID=32201 RepID=A0A8T1QSP4_CARIL|nr:hypothetical protein CIPAW_04G078200 [Carya illinoinensis]